MAVLVPRAKGRYGLNRRVVNEEKGKLPHSDIPSKRMARSKGSMHIQEMKSLSMNDESPTKSSRSHRLDTVLEWFIRV